MQTRHEKAVVTQRIEYSLSHARHDFHVGDDIRRIGQFNADMRDGRTDWPHRKRHDIHGAALHAAIELTAQNRFHFGWVAPVVGRASVIGFFRANESAMLDARHVVWLAATQNRVGAQLRIQAYRRPVFD